MVDAVINFEYSGSQRWPGGTDVFTTRSLVFAAKELDNLLADKAVVPLSTFFHDETLTAAERQEVGLPAIPDEWFDARQGVETVDALIAHFEWLGPGTEFSPNERFAGGPVQDLVSDLRTVRSVLQAGVECGERFRFAVGD